MKYRVMIEERIKVFPVDSIIVELSGVLHDSREDAQKEMDSVRLEAMEHGNICSSWIDEVEE